MTAEQQIRDMLTRMGVVNAQAYTAGDLVELANLIASREAYRAVCADFHNAVVGAGRAGMLNMALVEQTDSRFCALEEQAQEAHWP